MSILSSSRVGKSSLALITTLGLALAVGACGSEEPPPTPFGPPPDMGPAPLPDPPPPPPTATTPLVAFTGATLIPMDVEGHVPGMTVLTRDGLIEAVGRDGDVTIPPEATVIDATGHYLMPGLADMHTHISVVVSLTAPPAPESAADQGTLFVANGVTTIMNMGDFGGHNVPALRDRFARGDDVGPFIILGHFARGSGDGGQSTYRATTEFEGRTIVDRAIREGYDFAKVYSGVTRSAFNAIVERSEAAGMPVFGHVPTELGITGALTGGQSMVAHASEYLTLHYGRQLDPSLTPAGINKASSGPGWMTTTLAASEGFRAAWGNNVAALNAYLAPPERGRRFTHPEIQSRWRFWLGLGGGTPGQLDAELPFILEYTAAFYRGGVNVLMGSDAADVAGVASGFSAHRELELLVQGGLTPYEALTTATANPGRFAAEYFPDMEPFGKIEPGYRADLILLNADPLLDVTNVRDRAGVMARGRWYTSAELDAMLEGLAQRYGQ